jgi:Zn-dependent alcohol dehydrogenase
MLISGEFQLNDMEKAFTLLKEGKGIKYALRP